jgi:site-specific DNA recombinase
MNYKQKKKISLKRTDTSITKNAVIYTRVSRKLQVENTSLESQKKYCLEFAKKNSYNVIAHFGGTFESAKSDERKEFNKMLNYVKKSKAKISSIIVYSIDRFSRSGANAIYISKQLKETGVSIIAVSQPTNTDTASGVLQQNIQFIFSQYDNDLRAEKTKNGMKERLLYGEWVFHLPLGYWRDKNTNNIHITEEGKLIEEGFSLFVRGYSMTDVQIQIARKGLNLKVQRWSEILRNPLYAGIMISNILDYKEVNWKYPSITTKDIFHRVQQLLEKKKLGFHSLKPKKEQFFFKSILKCNSCNASFSSYEVKKKKLFYYICNSRNCRTNISAQYIHGSFNTYLSTFNIDTTNIEAIYTSTTQLAKSIFKDYDDTRCALQIQSKELQERLDRTEKKFIDNQIDFNTFKKHQIEILEELASKSDLINSYSYDVSNLCHDIEISLQIFSKINFLWANSSYEVKEQLLKLLFPAGIHFDKEHDKYRTLEFNKVLKIVLGVVDDYKTKKIGVKGSKMDRTWNSCFSKRF